MIHLIAKRIRAFKYLSILILPVTVAIAFILQGGWTFFPVLYGFILVPFLELFLAPNQKNMTATEEELIREDPLYDWMIYLTVPVQYFMLFWFLWTIVQPGLEIYEYIGLVMSMGLMCGTMGINIGHELGHRTKPLERFLAKASLLSSFYMHFFIEHNRGHHKRVATPEDPASARLGETVYTFWIRSVVFSFLSAWELEKSLLEKGGKMPFSWENEMIRYLVIQAVFLILIGLVFGILGVAMFLLASIGGILQLETVNYIEHYGLVRKKNDEGKYERVMPHHSWNSNHVIGRLMLFELSRHSDHHYLASRKYQVLRHFDEAPQMPTGYPGMMILSMVPPLWFWVMHREINRLSTSTLP